MQNRFEDLPVVQLPVVDIEDVRQQAELLKLTGVTHVSYGLLRRRMQPREQIFQGDVDALPLPGTPPLPDPDVIETLLEWTLAQVSEVQAQMFAFLEDPDTEFDETVEFLVSAQILQSPKRHSHGRELSTAALFLAALPATKLELYAYARSILTSTRRPEATVRQWLRRSLETELVVVTDDVISRKEPS